MRQVARKRHWLYCIISLDHQPKGAGSLVLLDDITLCPQISPFSSRLQKVLFDKFKLYSTQFNHCCKMTVISVARHDHGTRRTAKRKPGDGHWPHWFLIVMLVVLWIVDPRSQTHWFSWPRRWHGFNYASGKR